MAFGISNIVAGAGRALRLPEFNVSERMRKTGGMTFPTQTPFVGGRPIQSVDPFYTPTASAAFGSSVQQYPTSIGPRPSAPRVSTPYRAPSNKVATPRVGAVQQATNIAKTNRPSAVDPNAEFNRQLDELYGGTDQFLQNMRGSYEGNRNDILGAVGSRFDAQRPFLDQARNELIGLNQQQVEAEKRNAENALAEARLLYNELGQSNRQRFGGTSSTGEFANAIQGREFQRSQGRIQDTSGQNLNALAERAQSIETNYQNQIVQLEREKQTALAQARSEYDEKIRQIDALRNENQQAKAAAKLDALRELRNRANAIEDFKTQFQAQLESQTLAAAQNIYSAIQSFRAEQGQPVELSGLPGAQFSSIMGNAGVQDSVLPMGSFRRPDTSEQLLPTGLFRPQEDLALAA